MTSFPEGLFGGSWVLRGLVLLIAVPTLLVFLTLPPEEDALGWVFRLGIHAALCLLVLAMGAPKRFHWAGRTLCGLVVVAYLGFVVALWIGELGEGDEGRGAPSVVTALIGALFVGLPALRYALTPPRSTEPHRLAFEAPPLRRAGGERVDPSDAAQAVGVRLLEVAAELGWRCDWHALEGERWSAVLEGGAGRTEVTVVVEAQPVEAQPDGLGIPPATSLVRLQLARTSPTDWTRDPLARAVDQASRSWSIRRSAA